MSEKTIVGKLRSRISELEDHILNLGQAAFCDEDIDTLTVGECRKRLKAFNYVWRASGRRRRVEHTTTLPRQ